MNELHERLNITSRHTCRYTIMEQPQHPGCKNVTHKSSYDIEAIPFTLFFVKQVRCRMISTKTMISLQQAAMTDRIYKISENLIGLIKSTKIQAIQNASIFTRSIPLIKR
jgi:hypothetical protein